MTVSGLFRFLWPFRRFTLETPLTPDEVVTRLTPEVDPERFGLFGAPGERPWIGSVGPGRVEMRRRIAYKNSFLPLVSATIAPASRGATVDVRMAMHPVVIAFMLFWLSGTSLGALAGLAAMVTQGNPGFLLVLLFPAFGIGLVALGFGREANIAEDLLRSMVPPHTGPSPGPFREFRGTGDLMG